MCDAVALSRVQRGRYKPRLHTERKRQALVGVDIEKSIVVVVRRRRRPELVDRPHRATALSDRMMGRSMALPSTSLTRSSAIALKQRLAAQSAPR